MNLMHLNESSVLHTLRQRYGSSLIHTFAGRHLLIMNPLKPLSSYSDRVRNTLPFTLTLKLNLNPKVFIMT